MVEQAHRAAAIVRETLRDAVIGVYLHGSAVEGGLRHRSDVDVLAVTRRPSTRDERRSMIAQLLPISGWHATDGPARSIELTIIVQDQVRPWRYPPVLDLQYGDWWRAEYGRDEEPWTSPSPDLAIVLTAARASGRALFGPPIAEVLDAVAIADLRRAVLDAMPSLIADVEGDEANVVLTFCRMWLTMVTGAIKPKDVAADWAVERLPPEHGEVVARARGVYLGESADDWEDLSDEVRVCVDALRREVELAAG
jgi:streptomycin 3"-adenylyltransferase